MTASMSFRPLRVALVSDGIYPYFKGGKEVRLDQMARRLARRDDVEVDVYTMRWWGSGSVRVEDGVTYRAVCRRWEMYVGARRSIVQALMFALACFRLLTVRADVIDVDHMPYLHAFSIRIVAWIRRTPLVLTWHEWWGPEYWREYLGVGGVVAATVERIVARCADHLVVDSEETRRRLVGAGIPLERITLVPLGVDVAGVRDAQAVGPGWDVLYAGRLLEHKRVDVLLDALAELASAGCRPRSLVVGVGPEEGRLRDQATRLGLEVEFRPPQEAQDQIWSLMKSSTVFAYPSVREGYGLSIAEAQACGATVVTTDHPDNHGQYLIEDGVTGYLCRPDVPALAEAIGRALDAPLDGSQLEDRSRARAWEPRVDELLACYRRQAVRLEP